MTRLTNLHEFEAAQLRRWEKMTIASDPIFGMVLENPLIARGLIERALPQQYIRNIKTVTPQLVVNGPIGSRGVRYDLVVSGGQGQTIVVEMQVANQGNLPFRLRYYQELLDLRLLQPGDDFAKLRHFPTYVIIFCRFDFFGQNRFRYEFANREVTHPQEALNDGRSLIVFNSRAPRNQQGSAAIQGFLDLMENRTDTRDKFAVTVQNEVQRVKQDPLRRSEFMKLEIEINRREHQAEARGEARGRARGAVQGRASLINYLHQAGKSADQIVAILVDQAKITEQEARREVQQFGLSLHN